MSEWRSFAVGQQNGVTILTLTKTRYANNDVLEFESSLLELVKRDQPQKLLIDMTTLEMSTNAVHSALLKAQKLVENYGGKLKLCNPSPMVIEALKITRLMGNIFDVEDSLEVALRAFSSNV